jgi:hypothetical protein
MGNEWSASRHGRFAPGESIPDTHWIGGWVGPRTGLDDIKKGKFMPLHYDFISQTDIKT